MRAKESALSARVLTVGNEYDGLGFRSSLRLGDIYLQTANLVDSSRCFAFVDFAAQAASAHSYACRHIERLVPDGRPSFLLTLIRRFCRRRNAQIYRRGKEEK